MFDLNPSVDHLMLDQDLPDPFDRDAPVHQPSWRDADVAPASDLGPTQRVRQAVGTRLIELGSALMVDDRTAHRPVAR
jgi:hypothetical protein